MLNTFNMGLRWKLSLGFAICAAIAALSGLAGIVSLGSIQANIKSTTLEIDENIDFQVAQIGQLMPLQAAAVSIVNAESEDELAEIRSSLKLAQNEKMDQTDKNTQLEALLGGLISLKSNQLKSLNELSKFNKSYQSLLGEVSKQAINIVDNAEFDSEIKISDAVGAIEQSIGATESGAPVIDRLTTISDTAGTAIATVLAASSVKATASELCATVNAVLATTDREYIDYLKIQITTLLDTIRNQLALLKGDEAAETILSMLDDLAGGVEKTCEARKQLLLAGYELNVAADEIRLRMNDVQDEVLTAARQLKSNADATLETSSFNVKKWQSIVLVLMVGSFLLAIVIGLYLSGMIIKPLNRVVHMLKDIAEGEGDLTARLEVQSRDEIGELAKWFNIFIEKLQTMIMDIAVNARLLTGSSNDLSALSTRMVSSAEQTSSQANDVAGAAEDMSLNINTIASTTEEMSVTVQNVSSTAEEMSLNVTAVAASMKKIPRNWPK